MTASGLGRVKTKSDLIVMPSGRQIFAFFCSPHDHRTKIPGAVIPRRVFTQPGSIVCITAVQHWGPLRPSQQTLEVGSRYLVLRYTSAKLHVSSRSDGRFAPTARARRHAKAIADCRPCLSR